MVKSKHMEQIHCYIEMRECEHTCPVRSKILARAKDASKYLAEILTDRTGGLAVNAAQTPA
jgi:predicted aldo/keto reductase-like oxidoreductase